MGKEVEGVPGAARVAALDPGFGPWLRQQRELRRIPLGYVAARTRIPRDRLERIEGGRERLGRDGQGRSTARLLALTIGADPDEASCLLTEPERRGRIGSALSGLPWLRWGLLGAAGAASLALFWVLADRVLSSEASHEARPEVVYRPDYVDRLLHRQGASRAPVGAGPPDPTGQPEPPAQSSQRQRSRRPERP